jgi:hypothetical protein
MYEILRAGHKAAKENLEEQRDRQEGYYDEKTKYRTFRPGDQVIIYYPHPPPGVSPKFHMFWKAFTVIEMVGRVNVKASQHNKKPIVVHIDRVLNFNASGSEKEQTENIPCIGVDLEAEQEWARLDREKALGQQEDEEEEEQEVQWHIRRRTAGASLLHPSSPATRQPVMAPTRQTPPPSPPPTAESNQDLLSTPPPSSSSGTRQPPLLLPVGKKKKRSKCRRVAAEGKPPAQAEAQAKREREPGAAALLRRAAIAAKAEKQAERPDTGWLDSLTQMGVAIYGRNNNLLMPGRKQEDPAADADDGAAAMLRLEQTEPTSQPPNAHLIQLIHGTARGATMDVWRILRAIAQVAVAAAAADVGRRSRHCCQARHGNAEVRADRADFAAPDAHSIHQSTGLPEKQPWTFGGSYWPSRN